MSHRAKHLPQVITQIKKRTPPEQDPHDAEEFSKKNCFYLFCFILALKSFIHQIVLISMELIYLERKFNCFFQILSQGLVHTKCLSVVQCYNRIMNLMYDNLAISISLLWSYLVSVIMASPKLIMMIDGCFCWA